MRMTWAIMIWKSKRHDHESEYDMEINYNAPKHIYFIGIGGISMSGLATIMLKAGFKVSGSDPTESELTRSLEREGAVIYYDQTTHHIEDDVDLVVYTAAIKKENPEYIYMNEKGFENMSRAEFLGLLMKNYKTPIAVSGTHGKTTTTSMLSEILLEADTDPTLSVGGVLESIGTNTRAGGDDYFLFEACEYTDSFLHFFPKISIILNVEEDHLDYFKDIDAIRCSFNRFAKINPETGLLVINGEIPAIEKVLDGVKCPVITYGSSDEYDVYADNITFDDNAHPTYTYHDKRSGESFDVTLAVTGIHNVYNSLAAIAVARYLDITPETIGAALKKCSGSKRRFEHRGSFNGVEVIDDYAHHPTEIKATLEAAGKIKHKDLWCVFQPHTYTRTKAFLHEFAEALSAADHVVLAPVYPAREKDIYGCNSQNLYEEIQKTGTDCYYLKTFEDILSHLYKNCINGDLLITLGAGDVVKIADKLTSK